MSVEPGVDSPGALYSLPSVYSAEMSSQTAIAEVAEAPLMHSVLGSNVKPLNYWLGCAGGNPNIFHEPEDNVSPLKCGPTPSSPEPFGG